MRYKYPLYALALLSTIVCHANPEGFHLVQGEAAAPISNGNTLQITTGDKAIIHWDRFSIDAGEVTRFVQPNASSTVLNRVMHGDPSTLLGTLEANGKVLLINPNGVLVGEGACINTASFIASTFDVMNEAFLQGTDLTFEGNSNACVTNLGTIKAWDGDVILIGYRVLNKGKIEAPSGLVSLAAGHEVLLKPVGAERVFIRPEMSEALIENSGQIAALHTELKADGNPYAFAIRNSGKIDALGKEEAGGRIYLVAQKGKIEVTGALIAEKGDVRLLGDSIALLDSAEIDTSGKMGAGQIVLGGDLHTENIYVSEKARLRADALEEGDGGKIILSANQSTALLGSLSARGGDKSGNGGFIEVSSKGPLFPEGPIDTSAPHGLAGTLLLDPSDISISSTADSGFSFSDGNFTFSITSPTISATTLQNKLALNNVTISTSSTTNSPIGTGKITLLTPVTWSSNCSLTLLADDTVTLSALVSNTGSGGFSMIAPKGLIIGSSASSGACGVSLKNGSISITSATGDLSLIGGSSPGAYAHLYTETGSIDITASNGALSLAGGYASSTHARIAADSGSVKLSLQGDLDLRGGSAGDARAYASIDGAAIAISCHNAHLQAGGGRGNYARIQTRGANAPISLIATGDISLTGGNSGRSSDASIQTFEGGNITLNSKTLQMTGSLSHTSQGGYTQIYTPKGNISIITTDDLSMRSGSHSGAFASIKAACGKILIQAGGDLNLTGAPKNLLSGSTAQISSSNGLRCDVSGTAKMLGYSQLKTSDGDLKLIAGEHIHMGLSSNISNSGEGVVLLVVDNLNPKSSGPGTFFLHTDGTDTAIQASSGIVRIFTSQKSLNTLSAQSNLQPVPLLINGTIYSPDNQSNSDTERFNTLYPSTFYGGSGFTLFYKTP